MLYSTKKQRQLVILPTSPSGVLLSQGLLHDLKQQRPTTRLDAMAVPSLQGLVKRLAPVKKTWNLPEPKQSWKAFWQAGQDLQQKSYNKAWILPETFKPALIPTLANIPERTGYRGKYRYVLLVDIRLPRRDCATNLLQHYRALAWPVADPLPTQAPPLLTTKPKQQAKLLEKFNLTTPATGGRPVLAFCPSAEFVQESLQTGNKAPLSAAITASLQEVVAAGGQIWLFASHSLAANLEAYLKQLPPELKAGITNLAGQLSWSQVIDLLSLAKKQLGADAELNLLAQSCGLENWQFNQQTQTPVNPELVRVFASQEFGGL